MKIILTLLFSLAQPVFANNLNCANVINTNDYKTATFLTFITYKVKPDLDELAIGGYKAASAKKIVKVLGSVSTQMRSAVLRAGQGRKGLSDLGNALNTKKVSLYTLPKSIAKINSTYGAQELASYIGLVSCGGTAINFYNNNYAYNIHFGTGKETSDKATGQSFAMGPAGKIENVKSSLFMKELQDYIIADSKKLREFYTALLQTLISTDTSNYVNLNPAGQRILTHFLALYIAEQNRNLMDGEVTLSSDAALFEMTLLATYYAGQNNAQLFNETSNMRNQINNKDFRKLGTSITAYTRERNPKLIKDIRRSFYGSRGRRANRKVNKLGGNIFKELSQFLINSRQRKALGDRGYAIVDTFVTFLEQVNKDTPATLN